MSKIIKSIYFYFRLSILPIKEINKNIPKDGVILDLGCSYGALAIILARLSKNRKVYGWDLDKKKLKMAKGSLKRDRNVFFVSKDVIQDKYPESSGILASDLLHHLPKEQQEMVIKKAYKALTKNGVFVLKEVDKEDWIRSSMSRTWDKVLYPKDKIYYRTKNEWTKILRREGFRVSSENLIPWLPNSTRLFICTK